MEALGMGGSEAVEVGAKFVVPSELVVYPAWDAGLTCHQLPLVLDARVTSCP